MHFIRPRNSRPQQQVPDTSGNAGMPDIMTMPTEVDHEELEVVPNHVHGILERLQAIQPQSMEHPTLQTL